MLGESHPCLYLLARVLFDHGYDFWDHLFFEVGDGSIGSGLVCELAVWGVALGEVGVEPYFDLPVSVHADHIFCGLEVAHPKEYFFESIESTEENIQIFWEGDIFDVAESDGYVFDVYFSIVIGVAELLYFFWVDELGVDDAVFSLAPLEKLQILLIFSRVMEVNLVLLHLLVG